MWTVNQWKHVKQVQKSLSDQNQIKIMWWFDHLGWCQLIILWSARLAQIYTINHSTKRNEFTQVINNEHVVVHLIGLMSANFKCRWSVSLIGLDASAESYIYVFSEIDSNYLIKIRSLSHGCPHTLANIRCRCQISPIDLIGPGFLWQSLCWTYTVMCHAFILISLRWIYVDFVDYNLAWWQQSQFVSGSSQMKMFSGNREKV